MGMRILYTESPAWEGPLRAGEQIIASDRFTLSKDIPRNRAGLLVLDHFGVVFVKRMAAASWVRGIAWRLRGSPAARSLRAARELAQTGFLFPRPLAAADCLATGAIRVSWLFSEALTQAAMFSVFLDRRRGGQRLQWRWRRAVLAAVATTIRRMHEEGLFSSDLQETNLMLEGEPEQLQIYFVDLDGLRRLPRVSWRRRRRNLVQLDRSVGRFLSRSERLHFLRAYLGTPWPPARLKSLLEKLAQERAHKDRVYARRRQLARPGRFEHSANDHRTVGLFGRLSTPSRVNRNGLFDQ
ncbi:MAG TPA: lipopolysaccharide kinase InaA family protein [Candidatus Binataceae bacterium]|nr:lipopolysaccharide kinase InaA family protein [Candidatus Binataceae bacterium]